MSVNEKIENMLTYVAQEIISPLCFSDKTTKEHWEEYTRIQFNELVKIAHTPLEYVFIHGIIIQENEWEYYKNEKYFRDCADGDYIVHCLVNVNEKQVVLRDDNTHQPIGEMIDNFLYGFNYHKYKIYKVKYGLYIVPNNPYNSNLFTENVKFIELPY